jgi:formylglycine-generating enzyme required for sulfatase activity
MTPTPQNTSTPTPPNTSTPTPGAGHIITINLPGLEPGVRELIMVRIAAGSFYMGPPEDDRRINPVGTQHLVTIAYDFYLGQTEVTQAQWVAVMGSNPASGPSAVGPDYAVWNTTWNDCQAFVTALNGLGQGTFRLPSEAEWEYACRAGTDTQFSFGNTEGACSQFACEACAVAEPYMWWCGNSGGAVREVHLKLANPWDLFDMHGNAFEWCEDDWHDAYIGAPNDGSAWIDSPRGESRVLRSGSFAYGVGACASYERNSALTDEAMLDTGVRIVLEVP